MTIRRISLFFVCIGVLLPLLVACVGADPEKDIEWGPGAPLTTRPFADAVGRIVVVKDEHLYMVTISNADLSLVTTIPVEINGSLSFPAPSPDGQYMFLPSVRSAYVVSMDGTQEIELPVDSYIRYPVWSADSTSVAYVAYEGLRVSAIDRDSVYTKTITSENSVRSITWSPDQSRLAFTYLLDLFTIPVTTTDGHNMLPHQPTPIIRDGQAHPNLVYDWSPDGRSLVGVDGWNVRIAAVDGTASSTVPIPGGYASFLQWSPDGEQIAAGMRNLWLIDPTTLRTTQLTHFEDILAVRHGSWSPDGSRIVFGSRLRYDVIADWGKIYVIDRDGSHLIHLTNEDIAAISAPVWSPDGEFILFRGGIEDGINKFEEQGIYLARADGSAITLLVPNGQWAAWLPE